MLLPGRTRSRVTFSFLIGIVCIILGGVPLLKLRFATTMPQIFSPMIIKIVLLLGGLMLLYDGFQIRNPMTGFPKYTALITGLCLAALGAVPLLMDLGWLNKYLPFIATLNISVGVLQGLLIFFGVYLIYDAWLLSKQLF